MANFFQSYRLLMGARNAGWVLACFLLDIQVAVGAEDIRGAKELVEIETPDVFPLGLWLAVAGGVLLLFLIWIYWRRRVKVKKAKSPLAVAFAALTELANGREALSAEVFASRAALAVRQYVSDQFGVVAPQRTTEEFFRLLAADPGSALVKQSDELQGFLRACDLAKFAGVHLNAKQRDELLQAARGFITASSAPVLPEANPKSKT